MSSRTARGSGWSIAPTPSTHSSSTEEIRSVCATRRHLDSVLSLYQHWSLSALEEKGHNKTFLMWSASRNVLETADIHTTYKLRSIDQGMRRTRTYTMWHHSTVNITLHSSLYRRPWRNTDCVLWNCFASDAFFFFFFLNDRVVLDWTRNRREWLLFFEMSLQTRVHGHSLEKTRHWLRKAMKHWFIFHNHTHFYTEMLLNTNLLISGAFGDPTISSWNS